MTPSSSFHRSIGFTLFKEGIDIQKAINTIQWTIEKLYEEYLQKIKIKNKKLDFSEILSEINKYLDMFRKVFYK